MHWKVRGRGREEGKRGIDSCVYGMEGKKQKVGGGGGKGWEGGGEEGEEVS